MSKQMQQKSTLKKEAMLKALEKALGIVTLACKEVGIDRGTHYDWYNNDTKYKDAVDALNDVVLDFAENKLHKLVDKGDTSATIFILKCKGKKRGYVEKSEMDLTTNGKEIKQIFKIGNQEIEI
jgi:hypothetical protein